MKKGVLVVWLLIIVFLSSLVSAGFFSDTWSRITGAQVEENIEIKPASETPTPVPEPSPEEMTCGEYCKMNTMPPVGCINELKVSGIYPDCKCEWICKESIYSEYQSEKQCGEGEVKDYVCKDRTKVPWCKCEKGMWVCMISPENACPREIEEIRECAARIEVSSNQEVYYFKNHLEIKVEIFDTTGKILSNYPFYSEIYDGVWHTPERSRTDAEGFKRHEGTIGEGINVFGKIKFKVYTEVTGCSRVEDDLEIEIKKREEVEEVCGIGVCIPDEKEEKEKVKGLLAATCLGCEKDGKCYPMGYRKEGNYCSEDYNFVEQLQDDARCENNFECKSNFCISGQCVSENLMMRVINWFKRLVGVESELPVFEPNPEICSDLLIEKNILDYEYINSEYGGSKESQVQLYSEDGEQIGVVKCCMARYMDKEENEGGAMVCPFDNREDIENLLKWLSNRGEISLSEYNGQNVIKDAERVVAWTHNNHVISVGGDRNKGKSFSEDIANAYFEKYPNDLGDIEISKRDIPYEPKPWVSCSEEDERAVKECLSHSGSRLQTDPHPEKDCEVYVGCILSDESVEYRDSAKEFLIKSESIGELTLIDFETLPNKETIHNGDKLTGNEWENLGVVFKSPSEDYLKVFGPMHPFNPLDKLSLSPGFGPFESGSDTHDDLSIIFTKPVKAAGIYLLDLGETDERESISFLDDNNNVIKKISPWPKSTFGNPAPGTFIGLIHEEGISKIEILENTQDGDDIAYDNLYFVK